MQIKSELFKFRRIIAITFASISLFVLIIFIFFSASQSSTIFEKLLHDVYKIEIDLITLCDFEINDGSRKMDWIYAVELINILDKGVFRYKMILSDQGYAVVDSFYYLIKNKIIEHTDYIVFTKKEYVTLQSGISKIQTYILETSKEQKRALNILFILLLFVVALLLLLFIAASIRFDKEKRRHEYHMKLAQNISESENRIHNLLSSELHDDIGQMLVFLKLKLLDTNSPLSREIDPIIDSVRNLSHNLKIPEFSEGEFKVIVEKLISQFSTASSIKVEYTISDFHNELYPDYYPIIIFRVIQEFLQNAVKHSMAKNIRLNLVESAPFLIIRYKDDGIGMDGNTVILRSIEERAKLLNSELKIESNINKGLKIVMKIPFVKEQDYYGK